jgi:N-acyl-phosphatidylethanolamine-hydrolysing phospholipase D
VGVHWGTFNLTDEPLDHPPKDLAVAVKERELAADAFTVMAVGETRVLPARPSP